jgi:probable F420-dependent oxidoreductase
MKIDTFLGTAETASADAREAESLGYDGIFTGELNADPFLPLALAAEATSRAEVGTAIAVAFARSPMNLAYAAWDLQRLSRGRLVLGLGSQVRAHVTRRFAMPWGRPAAQLNDYVLALRAIWSSWATGEPLRYTSEHYSHTLMPPAFVPVQHDYAPPPILLAGVGEAMTKVAGEVADGFVAHAFTTPRWLRERTLPTLAAGRGSLDGFTIKATAFLATGTDAQIDTAVRQFRQQLAFYASTPAYRPLLELHGWGALADDLHALTKANRWAEMPALIDDEILHTFAIVAPLAEVAAEVERRFGDTATRLSFITHADQEQVMNAVG